MHLPRQVWRHEPKLCFQKVICPARMVEEVLIQSLAIHCHLAVVQLGVQLLHSVQIEAGLTVSIVLFYHLQSSKSCFAPWSQVAKIGQPLITEPNSALTCTRVYPILQNGC